MSASVPTLDLYNKLETEIVFLD